MNFVAHFSKLFINDVRLSVLRLIPADPISLYFSLLKKNLFGRLAQHCLQVSFMTVLREFFFFRNLYFPEFSTEFSEISGLSTYTFDFNNQ